jgi:hypothetical protein
MDWIKKNYEKFALLLLSIGLLGVSGYLFWSSLSFLAVFEGLKAPVNHGNKIPPLDTKSFEIAEAALQKPATWTLHSGSIFVSRKYLVKDGQLVEIGGADIDEKTMLHPPVPNSWFAKYNLDILDPDILNEDPDGDGFSNLEEFLAGTDPTDKNSHPAYTTKLRLKQFIKVPFRLVYKARPDPDSFQINTVDIRQPSQILKIGDQIAGTKFKILKFVDKIVKDSNDIEQDKSELTIQNIETGEVVVLVYGIVVDSPDSYAYFKYLWDNTEFSVKKDKEFTLKPENEVKYKLIDINPKEALIQNLKTGEQIKIPLLEQPRN